MNALELAIKFHETYERLAPSFGYETRTETRTFDPESKNGKLMVAVCGEMSAQVADAMNGEQDETPVTEEWLSNRFPLLAGIAGDWINLDAEGRFQVVFGKETFIDHEGERLLTKPTRGQLRTLCKALGIALPPTQPPQE